jgi:hypothetical protein
VTLPIIWKRRLHNAGGHPASALLADTQGLGETTVKHCANRKIRSLHFIAACAILLSLRMSKADDKIERGSVIPIGQKSAEHVGTPITVDTVTAGTSSRRTRKIALEEFPSNLMDSKSKLIAQDIFDNLSLYRRLPTIELEADRRCYEYFTNHPDVAVSIWRAMEISQVEMSKKSKTIYETDTRDGTKGTVRVLLNTPEHYVVTCHGEFKSPAIKKPIQAIAMMHLKPQFNQSGKVTHQLDMYVSFPSSAVEALARFISPVSNRIADRNFEEISLFVEMMSVAMARQPGWIEQLTTKLDGIKPADSDELLKLTAAIYVDAVKAERTVSQKTVELEEILPPIQTAALPE